MFCGVSPCMHPDGPGDVTMIEQHLITADESIQSYVQACTAGVWHRCALGPNATLPRMACVFAESRDGNACMQCHSSLAMPAYVAVKSRQMCNLHIHQ